MLEVTKYEKNAIMDQMYTCLEHDLLNKDDCTQIRKIMISACKRKIAERQNMEGVEPRVL